MPPAPRLHHQGRRKRRLALAADALPFCRVLLSRLLEYSTRHGTGFRKGCCLVDRCLHAFLRSPNRSTRNMT